MFPSGPPHLPKQMFYLSQNRTAVSRLSHVLGSQHRFWSWAPGGTQFQLWIDHPFRGPGQAGAQRYPLRSSTTAKMGSTGSN